MKFSDLLLSKLIIGLALLVSLTLGLQVTLNPQNTVQVSPYFASLAVEYFAIRDVFLVLPFQPAPPPSQIATELPKRLNMATMQLLQNLGELTGSDVPLIIRIGGNSANHLWLKTSTQPRMDLQTDEVSEYDFQVLGAVANVTNIKFILNIGMPTPQPIYAAEVLDLIKKYIPTSSVYAIEVGNEPDHLSKKGYRPETYTPEDYYKEYDVYANAVRQVLGNVDLMGPSYAYPWREAGFQIPFINQKASSTKYMSFHRYAIRGCSLNPTLDMLLDDPLPATYEWVSQLTGATKATNTINVWGEGGTASCSGVKGISDVFGSGLWSVDILFEMAQRGVGFSIFSGTPQATYAPFITTGGKLDVRPTFYGMLLFNLALGSTSSVIYRPTASGTGNRLKAWATFDSNSNTHTVVVIHKSNGPDEQVTIQVPSGPAPAKAQKIVMTAPAITSTTGHTIAGFSFDDSPDGLPSSGQYSEEALTANGDQISFVAPKGSVTLVKIHYTNDKPAPLLALSYSDGIKRLSAQTGIKPGTKIKPGYILPNFAMKKLVLSPLLIVFGVLLSFTF